MKQHPSKAITIGDKLALFQDIIAKVKFQRISFVIFEMDFTLSISLGKKHIFNKLGVKPVVLYKYLENV